MEIEFVVCETQDFASLQGWRRCNCAGKGVEGGGGRGFWVIGNAS